ncbi:MAG: flagellar FlbD family protein [Pseudobdellovibrionaceae bacterium]
MIELTSLIGKTVFVNSDLIRSIESTPDTILCFLDGTRVPVRETPQQIQEKVIQFKQLIFQGSGRGFASWE